MGLTVRRTDDQGQSGLGLRVLVSVVPAVTLRSCCRSSQLVSASTPGLAGCRSSLAQKA